MDDELKDSKDSKDKKAHMDSKGHKA